MPAESWHLRQFAPTIALRGPFVAAPGGKRVDRATRAKVDSLLYELRSWSPGEQRYSIEELARRFHLDPFVVRRIAETEGHDLESGVPDTTTHADDSKPTIVVYED